MAPYFQKLPFLMLAWLWQFYYSVETCPDICQCYNNTTFCAECSYNITLKESSKILTVPICCHMANDLCSSTDYSNITMTEISFNFVKNCTSNNVQFDYSCLDSYSLNFRNNNIRKLKLNINYKNLRVIDLSLNKLQYIFKGMFSNFSYLTKLIISKNEINNIIEGGFSGLTKLEALDLSENKLTTLSNAFTPLKNLQHLNLSRNNIEFLDEDYFNNWLLQHLDVSHNNLKKVAPGALQLLPNLARLLLTDNPHLGITQLDTRLLVGTGRRLQQIDASRTGLYQVPEAFTHSVRFLSLVGNKISAIRCGDLDSYPLLQSLDFTDNKIVTVEDDSIGRLEMLLFLKINKNLLTFVPKSLPDELKYLSLSNNLIKNLTTPDFKDMPNLRILLLQNNQIRYIQDHVFDDLLSLEMLDLSNNPLQVLSSSTFEGPLSLRDLRLCYLNISIPRGGEEGSFPISASESIQMLHLQSSPNLARQLLLDSAALAGLSHLQYLDLRMNNLSEIRNDLLFYLVQLKTLRLHGNSLNCSAEMWLREWMNWNKSDETCYYSTSETTEEETKYNCTFSETFTISESLPPVNLYSTEMINKLLRYYGYLNNKTERVSFKRGSTEVEKLTNTSYAFQSEKNLLHNDGTIKIGNDSVFEVTNITKPKPELSNIIENTMILNEHKSKDHKYYADPILLNEVKHSNADENNVDNKKQWMESNKNKTGKRLNTPLNVTRKFLARNLNQSSQHNSANIHKGSRTVTINDTEDASITESYTTHSMIETQYSHYQSVPSKLAQYIGTGAVCILVIASVLVWTSFRRRYRRREPQANEQVDQIEVSSISTGMLW